MKNEFTVKFDGRVYVARKRGAPGRVFGDTLKDALKNAEHHGWSHGRTRTRDDGPLTSSKLWNRGQVFTLAEPEVA
jgi:hypothetical protein